MGESDRSDVLDLLDVLDRSDGAESAVRLKLGAIKPRDGSQSRPL